MIGAHGEEEGNWYIALDSGTPVPAVYETIEKCTTIKIPAAVMGPQTWVRLKSCLLGDINPLLLVLKKALGNPPAVTAPRYIHAHLNGYLSGIWEFMIYQFVVVGPDSGQKSLADRSAAKAAFADPSNHFQLVDKSAILAGLWDTWIPPAASLNLAPSTANKATTPFVARVSNFFWQWARRIRSAGNPVSLGTRNRSNRTAGERLYSSWGRYTARHAQRFVSG